MHDEIDTNAATGAPAAEAESNHGARLEYLERAEYETRHAMVRRADKRLLLLYAVLVAMFLLLAYRTESNDTNLRSGLYDACLGRNAQVQTVNQLRQVFIGTITSSSIRTPEEKAKLIDQLSSFLQPVEDCGPDPR